MSDEKVRNLLKEWGFDNLIAVFEEQEIDHDSLLCLTDNIIKEMVPKIGPRVKFMKKLTSYVMGTEILNVPIEIVPALPLVDASPPKTDEESSSVTLSVDSEGNLSFLSENDSIPTSITPSNTPLGKRNRSPSPESSPALYKQYKSFHGVQQYQKSCFRTYHFDLHKFLNTNTTGLYILSTYEQNKILNKKCRNALVALIIDELLAKHNYALTNEDFEILSEKIVEIFPNENKSTYFIKSTKMTDHTGQRKVLNAKGKLTDKYRNMKHKYKIVLKELPVEQTSDKISTTDAMLESKIWLENNSEPWEEVIEHWKITACMRRNSVTKTVEELFLEWPILKKSFGYVLINHDFKLMYDSDMALFRKFDIFFKKLMTLKKESELDKYGQELLNCLNTEMSEDSKYAIKITLLSCFLPPCRRLRTKNKNHWKPSINESQQSLISHVKLPADIEKFIAERRIKYKKFNVPIQPYLIVVGPELTQIHDIYLQVGETLYKLESTLKGFDTLFKSFHTLNAAYPIESEHIFLLIQRAVYNIATRFDKHIPQVETALADIGEITLN